MISSEVQRTLVKSPPELWAELSDPAALARHLGELGEIRIVRTEPERTVEWAAENTTGVVSIKPSGWGTKVTLSVSRESVEDGSTSAAEIDAGAESPRLAAAASTAAPEPEPEPESEPAPVPVPEYDAIAPRESPASAEPTSPAPVAGPEPAAEVATEPQPEPRRGFFARLFGRRRASAPTATAGHATAEPDAFAAVRRVLEPQAFAQEHPFAVVPAPATASDSGATPSEPSDTQAEIERHEAPAQVERTDDISAELMAAESVAAEQVSAEEVTAVLTAVLDRLGAAHHRPFSRS
jgi:hypothetical protein